MGNLVLDKFDEITDRVIAKINKKAYERGNPVVVFKVLKCFIYCAKTFLGEDDSDVKELKNMIRSKKLVKQLIEEEECYCQLH